MLCRQSVQVSPALLTLCEGNRWLFCVVSLNHLRHRGTYLTSPSYIWSDPLLYPRSTEGGMGVYWIHPRCLPVRLSVRPSVCRQSFRNFWKKLLAQFISYLAFTLMGVSWPLYIFCVPSLIIGPSFYPYGLSLLTPIDFRVPVAKYLV